MFTIKDIEKEILVIIIDNVHHWKSTDKVTKAELLRLKKELRILTIQKMKDLALELAGEEKNISKVHDFDWKEELNKFGNIKESLAKHYAGGEISGYNQKRKMILEHPILEK